MKTVYISFLNIPYNHSSDIHTNQRMYASRLYVPAHKVDINIDRVAILPEPLKIKLDVFTFDWKELYDVFQIDNSIQEGYLYVSELGITPYALLEIDKIVWENA